MIWDLENYRWSANFRSRAVIAVNNRRVVEFSSRKVEFPNNVPCLATRSIEKPRTLVNIARLLLSRYLSVSGITHGESTKTEEKSREWQFLSAIVALATGKQSGWIMPGINRLLCDHAWDLRRALRASDEKHGRIRRWNYRTRFLPHFIDPFIHPIHVVTHV